MSTPLDMIYGLLTGHMIGPLARITMGYISIQDIITGRLPESMCITITFKTRAVEYILSICSLTRDKMSVTMKEWGSRRSRINNTLWGMCRYDDLIRVITRGSVESMCLIVPGGRSTRRNKVITSMAARLHNVIILGRDELPTRKRGRLTIDEQKKEDQAHLIRIWNM